MKPPIKPCNYNRINNPPEKEITKKTVISKTQIWDGDGIDFSKFTGKVYFDVNYDTDGDEYYLIEYQETTYPNPDYEAQLTKYEATKHEYVKALAKYNQELSEYNAWMEKEREKSDFEMYQKLKERFESK